MNRCNVNCSRSIEAKLSPPKEMLPSTGRWAIHINTISPRTASGAAAEFTNPMGALELPCGRVLLSDRHRIRVLSADLQGLFEVAGGPTRFHHDGPATIAKFCWPHAFALLPDQRVLVTDMGNHRIRMLSADLQQVSTLAGDGGYGHRDGAAAQAQFHQPHSLTLLPDGRVLMDEGNHRIRVLSADLQQVSTLTNADELGIPTALELLPDGRLLVGCFNRICVLEGFPAAPLSTKPSHKPPKKKNQKKKKKRALAGGASSSGQLVPKRSRSGASSSAAAALSSSDSEDEEQPGGSAAEAEPLV